MEYAGKRFARRVLLAHVAVLLMLLAVVFFASHAIYRQARQQALRQTQERQELLASQTAHAVQNFYGAILSDLELLRPADPDDPDSDYVAPRRATTAPFRALGARGVVVAPLLSQQLQGRISFLFTIDKAQLRPRWVGIGAEETAPSVKEVAAKCGPWIRKLDQPAISPFEVFGDRGLSLVCIPVDKANVVLVAAVAGRRLEHLFLDEVNRAASEAFLVDDSLTVMTASRPDLIGASLADAPDPQVRSAVAAFQEDNFRGTRELSRSFMLGPERFAPALVTVEPIHVSDKHWFLLLTSPLADVDSVVRELFHRVVWWGAFLAAAIVAVLASTAVQLIRGRQRLDRVRHELLSRELKQAREIQLAWLPEHSNGAARGWDIATVNQPASHISGDFYNFFDLPDGRTVVCIGDVTGHGISAAFLMATTQLLVRNTMPRLTDPARCLEDVNRQLCVQVFNGQFVTMQILVLDTQRGRLQIATAGHPAPLVSDGESYQPLPLEPELVLGVDKDATYCTQTFDLAASNSILLYTDGVVDVERAGGERFGADRLRGTLYGRFATAQEMLDRVLAAVTQFRAGYDLHDDLTLVAVQVQVAAREKPHPKPATA